MEEIFKAILGRGFSTIEYFEGVSYNKKTISSSEFSKALLNLNLKTVSISDI